jgi:hypothetical protein
MFSQNQNFVEITSVLAFSLLSNCVSAQSCRQSVKNSVADLDPGSGAFF